MIKFCHAVVVIATRSSKLWRSVQSIFVLQSYNSCYETLPVFSLHQEGEGPDHVAAPRWATP